MLYIPFDRATITKFIYGPHWFPPIIHQLKILSSIFRLDPKYLILVTRTPRTQPLPTSSALPLTPTPWRVTMTNYSTVSTRPCSRPSLSLEGHGGLSLSSTYVRLVLDSARVPPTFQSSYRPQSTDGLVYSLARSRNPLSGMQPGKRSFLNETTARGHTSPS